MNRRRTLYICFTFFLIVYGQTYAQFYNGHQMAFGKNRVQYYDFYWSFYRFEKFDIYFNEFGKELAEYTASVTEKKLIEIEDYFDYYLDKRLIFIVYNKLSDYKQSNLGQVTGTEDYNIGGYTRIIRNKVMLYFNGKHPDFEKQIAGVQISMASEITISHNSIYDLPRAGINISEGTWGGHIIEFNDVFNTVLETGDHGSFNSWGRDRFWHPHRRIIDSLNLENPDFYKLDAIKTTVIRNNRFRCDCGCYIDLDDGSCNYHIYNNLCLKGGLKLREGFGRIVENNIMINNSFHPHVWFENSRDVFQKNIVSTRYYPISVKVWGENIDDNIFLDSLGLINSQKIGNDSSSIVADIQFKNTEKGDFSVINTESIETTGFENFDMNSFGVLSEHLKNKAKTPKIPVLITNKAFGDNSKIYKILGSSLKNVNGVEEKSAYGLKDETGVIVVEVGDNTAMEKAGMQNNDVIIEMNNRTINSVKDIIALLNNESWKGSYEIETIIIRNQEELKLIIAK